MVVALVVGALLAVPATPALAAAPGVQITNLSSGTITSGQRATLSFRVTNNNIKLPPANSDSVTVKVTTSFGELTCSGRCDFTEEINRGDSKDYTVSLVAGNVAAGDTKSGKVQITAAVGGETGSAERDVTVKGPEKQEVQTVKLISGKVTVAATGDPVPNATVMLLDSQQHRQTTTSDSSGNFRFSGSTSNPITPGRIELGAIKNEIQATKTVSASAGQSLTGQRISLAIKVEVSPSASAPASDEALPTDETTDEATDEPTEAAPGQQAAAGQDSGGSWLLILLGGLFVAVGVGTIVLLYMRRKGDGDDEDGPGGAGVGAVPGARGGYRGADDQTRVVNGMGAGAAPTMVGGTSLSDAPTMMHRPVVDDVPPDPYGAPPPAYGAGGQPGWAGNGYGDETPGQGGYGGNGYGNAPSSGGGYGNAPSSGGGYGNAPSSGGGYGSRDYGAGAAGYPPAPSGGGYGEPAHGGGYGERYDEPTGRYTGDATGYTPPADPYPTSTYQPDQGRGYGQQDAGQYGRGPEPTNGYGAGGGYGAPAGGGYDGGQQGYDGGQPGYDQRGGYGEGYGQQQSGGYGQQGGYGQEPPQQRGAGYDNQGYDQGGYYGDPAQAGRGRPDGPPQERGGRRLDWLDD